MSSKDSNYHDPLVAACYDALNPRSEDADFYVGLAGSRKGGKVLDFGCGTGKLASILVEKGHPVLGLDPAAPMLEMASRRAAPLARWVLGDARRFSSPERFDFAFMTGHVFQLFLTDEDASCVLATARNHLSDGGLLAFETRNPNAQAWTGWTPERSRQQVEIPTIGKVVVEHRVVDVSGEIITLDTAFEFMSLHERRVCRSQLRFMKAGHLQDLLATSGFSRVDLLGDWHGQPFQPGSPEIIVLARVI